MDTTPMVIGLAMVIPSPSTRLVRYTEASFAAAAVIFVVFFFRALLSTLKAGIGVDPLPFSFVVFAAGAVILLVVTHNSILVPLAAGQMSESLQRRITFVSVLAIPFGIGVGFVLLQAEYEKLGALSIQHPSD